MTHGIVPIYKGIRALTSLAMAVLVGAAGWMAYSVFHERELMQRDLEQRAAELAAKTAEVETLTQDNERLNLALRLLKVNHRVAELVVLDQQQGGERPTTRFQFVELNQDGEPIGQRRAFTVDGDMIYVDAWVIKYADELVESADPLRATSVCLFRRVFGEYQEPNQGFPLDAAGSRPAVYGQGDEISPLERDIWAHFWEYANNPIKARQAGVRAAHGEAPFIRLEKGKRYKVELRASGGLSIVAEDLVPDRAS